MCDFNITGTGTFLECVEQLHLRNCDAIYGPTGGILILDAHNCLVYQKPIMGRPYFSAISYLGQWRTIKFLQQIVTIEHVDS